MTGGSQLRRRLPLHPASVGAARRIVRAAVGETGRTDLVDAAELLVSEVVTNALLHAGTHLDLSVSAADAGLLVLVSDGSPQPPGLSGPRPLTAATGRGLLLIDEISSAWGVMAHGSGKTVWFQLDATPTDEVARPVGEHATGTEIRTIELLDFPVQLAHAWRHHADALLREYLLANLTSTPKDTVLRTHACARKAVALLAEQVRRPPASRPAGFPAQDGVDEARPGERVSLQVPLSCVDDFGVLAETLAAAQRIAPAPAWERHGSGELSALTGWLCTQVEEQSRGLPPAPWPGNSHRG